MKKETAKERDERYKDNKMSMMDIVVESHIKGKNNINAIGQNIGELRKNECIGIIKRNGDING